MRYVGAGHEESKVLWEFVQSTLREEVTGQIGISESDELELGNFQSRLTLTGSRALPLVHLRFPVASKNRLDCVSKFRRTGYISCEGV